MTRFPIINMLAASTALLIILITSCGEGIAPIPADGKTYISGTITYVGGEENWPPGDSLFDMRVVCFKNYPPGDIIMEVLQGNAFFTEESIPFFVDTAGYFLEFKQPPVELQYIVVAQQYGNRIYSDWRVIGVYTRTGDPADPGIITLETGERNRNVNILVDFQNLPPQPF